MNWKLIETKFRRKTKVAGNAPESVSAGGEGPISRVLEPIRKNTDRKKKRNEETKRRAQIAPLRGDAKKVTTRGSAESSNETEDRAKSYTGGKREESEIGLSERSRRPEEKEVQVQTMDRGGTVSTMTRTTTNRKD